MPTSHISQELHDQLLEKYYAEPGRSVQDFRVLHLDAVSITAAWKELSGLRIEAKFLLKESGPHLLWQEVH